MTREVVSLTPEASIMDDTENCLRLDYVSLFKTLKDLLDDGIKMTMEAQFTALQSIFT